MEAIADPFAETIVDPFASAVPNATIVDPFAQSAAPQSQAAARETGKPGFGDLLKNDEPKVASMPEPELTSDEAAALAPELESSAVASGGAIDPRVSEYANKPFFGMNSITGINPVGSVATVLGLRHKIPVIAGAVERANEMATPMNAGMGAALSGAPAAVQKLASAYFAYQMGKGGIQDLSDAWEATTPEQRKQALGHAIIDIPGALAAGAHMAEMRPEAGGAKPESRAGGVTGDITAPPVDPEAQAAYDRFTKEAATKAQATGATETAAALAETPSAETPVKPPETAPAAPPAASEPSEPVTTPGQLSAEQHAQIEQTVAKTQKKLVDAEILSYRNDAEAERARDQAANGKMELDEDGNPTGEISAKGVKQHAVDWMNGKGNGTLDGFSAQSVAMSRLKDFSRQEQTAKAGSGKVGSLDEETPAGTKVGESMPAPEPTPDEEAAQNERNASVREAVSKLPAEHQQYANDLMAGKIGVSQIPAAARKSIAKALQPIAEGDEEGPGASNIRELQRKQIMAGADIFHGMRGDNGGEPPSFFDWQQQFEDPRTNIQKLEGSAEPDELPLSQQLGIYLRAKEASDIFNQREEAGGKPNMPAVVDSVLGKEMGDGSSKTGISNAAVDAERQGRGLPRLFSDARSTFRGTWDEGMRRMDADPQYQQQVVDGLLKDPSRKLDRHEIVAVSHRAVELKIAHDDALATRNELSDTSERLRSEGKEAEADEAQRQSDLQHDRVASISDQRTAMETAFRKTGSASSESLNFRRMMAKNDFSLGSMMQEARDLNGGKPIERGSPIEQKVTERSKALNESLDKANKAQEAVEGKKQKKASEQTMKADQKEAAKTEAKQKAVPPKQSVMQGPVGKFISKAVDDAKARIAARRGTLHSDPLGVMTAIDLADHAIIGAGKIAELGGKAAAKFGAWSKRMLDDVGEYVKPHLREIWDASKKQFDPVIKNAKLAASKDDILGRMEKMKGEGDDARDVRTMFRGARELGKSYIAQGDIGKLDPKVQEDALIDKIHPDLQKLDPTITRDEARKLYAGYGDIHFPSDAPNDVLARDLANQGQKVSALKDMSEGKMGQRSGGQRDVPSDINRKLTGELAEAKKKGGLEVQDPKLQMKTAEAQLETRLSNTLKDLGDEVEFGPRRPVEASVTTERASMLKGLIDRVKETLASIRETPEISDAERARRIMKSLDNVEKALRDQIDNDRYAPTKKAGFTTPEIEAKRAQIEELRQTRNEMKALDDEISGRNIESRREHLDRQIAEVQRKIDAREPAQKKTIKPEDDPLNAQLKELLDEKKETLAQQRKGPPKSDEQLALERWKTRIAAKTYDLQRRRAFQQFEPAVQKSPFVPAPDAEVNRLQAEHEQEVQKWENDKLRWRMENRPLWQRGASQIARLIAAGVVSGPKTIAHLGFSAAEIAAVSPLREFAARGWGKVFPEIAKNAPRWGNAGNVRVEAHAFSQAFTNMIFDVGYGLRTGHAEFDYVAKAVKAELPPELYDYVYHTHAAVKNSVRRLEYERSLQYFTEYAMRKGEDIRNPLVMMKLSNLAVKEANRSVYMNDADFVKGWNAMLKTMEGTPEKPKPIGTAIATVLRATQPVVKIPTNMVARALENITGIPFGLAKIAYKESGLQALVDKYANKGTGETVPFTEEQSDVLLRQLANGTVGAAIVTAALFSYKQFGGFFNHHYETKDEKKEDVKPMGVRNAGKDVPQVAVHGDLFLTAQVAANTAKVAESYAKKADMLPEGARYKGAKRGQTGTGKSTQGIGMGLASSLWGLAEETPFVGEPLRIGRGMEHPSGTSVAGGFVNLLTPAAIRQTSELLDQRKTKEPTQNASPFDVLSGQSETTRRDPKSFADYLRMMTPGLRQSVPEKKAR